MSSGNDFVLVNGRERLLSADAQQVVDKAGLSFVEALRAVVNTHTNKEGVGGSVEPAVSRAYRYGHVLRGMLPAVVNGTAQMAVGEGVVLFMQETGEADQDQALLAFGEAASLVLTPNDSAFVRVDVIECRFLRLPADANSADIFDLLSSDWLPRIVSKSELGRVEYRIRSGVPNNGYPGHDPDWLPIAVAAVKAGATTWDGATLWDVRPLVADRATPLGLAAHEFAAPGRTRIAHRYIVQTVPNTDRTARNVYAPDYERIVRFYTGTDGQPLADFVFNVVEGYAEREHFGYRVGGVLDSGVGDQLGSFPLTSADCQERGFLLPVHANCWHVWFCFPLTLPRWARYSDALHGERKPMGLSGIPLMTTMNPDNQGNATRDLLPPASIGLTGFIRTFECVYAFSGLSGTLNPISGAEDQAFPLHESDRVALGPSCSDGKRYFFSPIFDANGNELVSMGTRNATSLTSHVATFTIQDSLHHPGNARAVYVVTLGVAAALMAANPIDLYKRVEIVNPSAPLTLLYQWDEAPLEYLYLNADATIALGGNWRVPVVSTSYPLSNQARTFRLVFTVTANIDLNPAPLFLGQRMLINGWEIT